MSQAHSGCEGHNQGQTPILLTSVKASCVPQQMGNALTSLERGHKPHDILVPFRQIYDALLSPR